MKHVLGMATALVLVGPLAVVQAQSADARIAEAVKILPEDLQAGATVVTYDAATGARKVLRQGTNFIECQPRWLTASRAATTSRSAPRRDLEAKLRAEKKTDKQIPQAIAAAVKAGTLPASPPAMMSYRGYDKRDRIQNLWVISLPNRTPESVGVSTTSQRDAALEGKGLPWMMAPGTPGAHIMIPINPPAKNRPSPMWPPTRSRRRRCRCPRTCVRARRSTSTTRKPVSASSCARAPTSRVLAARRRWVHMVLPQGDGAAPRSSAKLRAEGKSDKEIQEAVAAATKAGTIKPTPYGTMMYRLYGKKDRIQLLWVLVVPGATPESIGVSEGSQRDEAMGGEGGPWLMNPGTPGAHIMIPINK